MKVKVKIPYAKLYQAVKSGIQSFENNNPGGDERYPIENYVTHQIAHCIEIEIANQNNLKVNSYRGWKFVDMKS